MYNSKFFTHISFMRKEIRFQPMKNIDEKELLIKDFIKRENKNEIGK